MSSKGRDLLKLSAIIAVAFALGIAFASALDLPRPGIAQQRLAVTAAAAPVQRVTGGPLPSFAEVVDRVNPAVVAVSTGRRERATAPSPRGIPPEFRDFFRFSPEPRYREGSGSGFIVSRDGYILTNNHVVADADRVTVRLLDNRVFTARVVGRDPNTDVAVIKIDAANLPTIVFGNSDQARIGDWVLAVGNPLGFTFTVTAGIISAKGRRLEGLVDETARYAIQDFIQTDAAINPGNSGGPLVSLAGEVIGINSAIASPTGTYAGYGFAIPINLARRVMDDLIATGRVTRAILGIRIGEITPEDASYVGLSEIRGVVVQGLPDGNSPARAVGITPGDVIIALNDTAIDHVAQLQQTVGFRRPGDIVRVTVVRREAGRVGVRRTFDVRLVAADDDGGFAQGEPRDEVKPSEMEGRLGIGVAPLTPELARRARLDDDLRGVVVADVEEGGPSWRRVFDPSSGGPEVIVRLNDTRVRTPEEFERAVRMVPRREVVQLQVVNLGGESPLMRIVRIRSR